jgi:hypothetical protein
MIKLMVESEDYITDPASLNKQPCDFVRAQSLWDQITNRVRLTEGLVFNQLFRVMSRDQARCQRNDRDLIMGMGRDDDRLYENKSFNWLKSFASDEAETAKNAPADEDEATEADDDADAGACDDAHDDVRMYISDPFPVCTRRPPTTLTDNPRLQRIVDGTTERTNRRLAVDASRPAAIPSKDDFEVHEPDYDAFTDVYIDRVHPLDRSADATANLRGSTHADADGSAFIFRHKPRRTGPRGRQKT